ncbi:MAG: dipeptide epimerase, partial [Gemmatimonadetes bacterium]|nr:dipeptide epimerase [Gemmatimonadota bacterium]
EEASGGDPHALERTERAVAKALGRNAAAKAGISMALHDLVGKRLGHPVWRLWGLDAEAPLSSFTIGIDEPELMRQKVREAAAYRILKVKVGTPRDPEILEAIRAEAPDAVIRVDANTGWTLKQAVAALPMLQQFGVELVEQPLAPTDLEGLRALRSQSPIPIIADESSIGLLDVPRLVGVVDGINIKLAKCGSMREATRMVHAARAHGMLVMLGCMVESTIGVAAAVQLAPLCDYLDLDGAALLANDPFVGPGIEPDGSIRFNETPGLGVARRQNSARTG